MVNNSNFSKWLRLHSKQLNNRFLQEIQTGCRCSPFEAQAVLETVQKVFAPFFENAGAIKPGQIQITIVSVQAPPGQSLKEAPVVTVTLTLICEPQDTLIRKEFGVVGLRHHRLQRLCREAIQQGGLLTVEDLANRLLNCGQRTLSRDIKTLKDKGIILPMRSTVKDMGRSISHRSDIVKHWLLGQEYSNIARLTFHSTKAVSNYVSKFKRVVVLTEEGYDISTISFLVRLSSSLVLEYQKLWQTLDIVPHRKEELINRSKKNTAGKSQNKSKN